MESKRKNTYIVIFVITTIICACLAIFFYLDGDKKVAKLKSEVTKVKENQNINENKKDVVEDDKDTKEVIKEKIVYKFQRPNIDSSKCINPYANGNYDIKRTADSSYGCYTAKINSKNEVELNIYWDAIEKRMGIMKPSTVSNALPTEKKLINNFQGNVTDIYIEKITDGVDEVLYFLMEDGSVEYMRMGTALQNDSYKSYGKLNGVKDVVEIIGNVILDGHLNYSIGLKQDGSFYDLTNIVFEMEK